VESIDDKQEFRSADFGSGLLVAEGEGKGTGKGAGEGPSVGDGKGCV